MRGLERAAQGEADAIDGWLAYGAALNEGRALFDGDREFGQWVAEMCSAKLAVHDHERAAAMWAAGHPDQFAEARAAGNARTVRGIHAKWKEIEQERAAAAKWQEAKTARREAAAQGDRCAASRSAAFTRDCQPGPSFLNASTTS